MNELQKSTQVTIPDLYALLPGWEFAVNPHYDAVKRKVDDMIVQSVEVPTKLFAVLTPVKVDAR